uniref:S-adenosylmethionine:tRNA ribosyltransferase-isomerase n=1 Tax=Actinacidiphila rubida TaxID=310780 RepID=UPI000AFF47CC
VTVPATAGSPAVDLGRHRAPRADLATASAQGRAATVRVPGGYALLRPTAVGSGTVAVVEVFVPVGDVTRGVAGAWLVLAGVGVALLIVSVAIADRLGARMIKPAVRLAGAAHRLGEGDLAVRVPEDGPGELRAAAAAFNAMADRVVQLLAGERELAADLSHRLRTPLTVLRLNTASLGDGPAADQTRAAVAQLEREVDQVIRTAREHRTPSALPAGCDAAEVIRERMAFWSALAEDERREVRTAGADRPARVRGGAELRLVAALDASGDRLWVAEPSVPAVERYLHRHGRPIRYSYTERDQPLSAYQTVFATGPAGGAGSAEMPSAGRPFTAPLVTELVSRGVQVAPIVLHTGVASAEAHEPPYAEPFAVPASTAWQVNAARAAGGRVVAVGTTAVRALESAADARGVVRAARGWTELVVTPERGVGVVDGLLTGLHEPEASHLLMLRAISGDALLERVYAEALRARYLWHEFGDVNLLLP